MMCETYAWLSGVHGKELAIPKMVFNLLLPRMLVLVERVEGELFDSK